jgi:hypothetical protein
MKLDKLCSQTKRNSLAGIQATGLFRKTVHVKVTLTHFIDARLYIRGSRPFFIDKHDSTVVLLFAREHRHKMSARTSTVYKYIRALSDIKRAPWCSRSPS